MTSPTDKHYEEAGQLLMQAITASRAKNAASGIEIIAAALANAEREGMKRAAEIALREGDKTVPAVGYVISQAILAEAGEG